MKYAKSNPIIYIPKHLNSLVCLCHIQKMEVKPMTNDDRRPFLKEKICIETFVDWENQLINTKN